MLYNHNVCLGPAFSLQIHSTIKEGLLTNLIIRSEMGDVLWPRIKQPCGIFCAKFQEKYYLEINSDFVVDDVQIEQKCKMCAFHFSGLT